MKFKYLLPIVFAASLLTGCHSQTALKTSNESVPGTATLLPTLYFNVDQADIRDPSIVDNNAQWLKNHRDRVVVLEGHCDERGDRNYNMLLGDRRARAVMQALMSRGVPENQMVIVSYGKDRPVLRSGSGWDKNRRVEFVVR